MAEMVIVSDYCGELFGKKLAEKLECAYIPISIKYFPDGEPDIEIMDNVRGKEVYYVCPYFPDPIKRKTEIDLINSTLKYSSAEKIIDVATYLGFMKKDWKDRPRVPISIREVAEAIEKYANRILTIDMHSPQIQGMFRIPLDHLDATVLFADHIKNNFNVSDIVIASPDVGGVKRAKLLADRIGNKEIAIVYKIRDTKTGKVTAVDVIGNVEKKKVVFYDDQAITLGSLCEAAKAVKQKGAKEVYAYCTHGLLVKKDGISAEKRVSDSLLEELYITDTIPRPDSYFEQNKKIKCISCTDLFANAISRIHNNESLSELFR
jgi:ribose-phosphate pyrophosphokinase